MRGSLVACISSSCVVCVRVPRLLKLLQLHPQGPLTPFRCFSRVHSLRVRRAERGGVSAQRDAVECGGHARARQGRSTV